VDADMDEAGGDPTISKVIKLLQGMLDKSKEDGETDTKLMAKYTCFCDTNEEEKKKSVQDLGKQVELLGAQIGQLQATNGLVSNDLAELHAQISDNEQARATADSVRGKAREAFLGEEADMKNAIGQMNQAIDMLGEMGSDAAVSDASLASLKGSVKKRSTKLHSLIAKTKEILKAASARLPSKLLRLVDNFLQAPFTGDYRSQSGEIIGILKNMRDTFKANLASSRSSEKVAAEAYTKISKAQEDAYANMKELEEMKQKKLAVNDETMGAKKATKEEAETSKADDEEFLAKLINMCQEKTKAFENRKMVRANEEAAISQATATLNSDEAFETFNTAGSSRESLLQLPSNSVASDLQHAAKKLKSIKLAKVAAAIRSGNPLNKVVSELDEMIELIAKEEQADVDKKDWCVAERARSHDELSVKKTDKQGLQSAITELRDTIDNTDTGIKALVKAEEAKLAENKKAQADEIEDRGLENAMYQAKVKNLHDSQKLLDKAMKVLKKFYDSKKQALIAQKKGKVSKVANFTIKQNATRKFNATQKARVSANATAVKKVNSSHKVNSTHKAAMTQKAKTMKKADPEPPVTFDELDGFEDGQGGKATDVVSMLGFILEETKKEEHEAHETEESSQHVFEDLMTDLKSQETDTQDTLVDYQDELSEKEKSLEQNKMDHEHVMHEKKTIENYLLSIKGECDFIMANIEKRQESRKAEEASLNGAKEQLYSTPAWKAAKAKEENEKLQAKKK
jgi:hypothetical protein